ncbi:hypothetical protein BT63DRAFT_409242 [Microthyrium microscopicum]|uniref:Uncharacterized protein n=1 Tax=Microthyrium microscopicum TaxID=703497 RepID=A0A6A6US71_9PEZI|nr:hypothetical protein BT63DRAFT_409242 [Microthyrium microscopicum]
MLQITGNLIRNLIRGKYHSSSFSTLSFDSTKPATAIMNRGTIPVDPDLRAYPGKRYASYASTNPAPAPVQRPAFTFNPHYQGPTMGHQAPTPSSPATGSMASHPRPAPVINGYVQRPSMGHQSPARQHPANSSMAPPRPASSFNAPTQRPATGYRSPAPQPPANGSMGPPPRPSGSEVRRQIQRRFQLAREELIKEAATKYGVPYTGFLYWIRSRYPPVEGLHFLDPNYPERCKFFTHLEWRWRKTEEDRNEEWDRVSEDS